MAKFAPDPLWTALREAGLADDSTRRVVIDVQSGHLPIVHTERFGDESLLDVVAIAGRVEIVRDGPSPVPEKPAEPRTGPVAGGAIPNDATAIPRGRPVADDEGGCTFYADKCHRTIDNLCPCGWRP